MPTPIMLYDSLPFSQIAPGVSGTGSTMSVSVPRPSVADDSVGFSSWPPPLHLSGERGEYTLADALFEQLVFPHILCRRKDVWQSPEFSYDGTHFVSASAPAVSRHAGWPRLRLSTAGFHDRRPGDCVWSLFFPRSVGLAPTASCASGALTMAPSILCHAQAIFSISSYSANPLRQSCTKNPARFHSRKYWWMELALPNRSSGNAFHWHPVRNTYTIPSNTFRESSGFRPPPDRLRYFRPFSRLRLGISGAALSHSKSDTVQLFIWPMIYLYHRAQIDVNYLRISSKCNQRSEPYSRRKILDIIKNIEDYFKIRRNA